MHTLRNKLIALAVLTVLAVIGAVMSSRPAAAQGPPNGLAVNIVNPLPLPVTGNTTVSGTVEATQSGTWNVGITGNSSSSPLFTRDVTNPVNQPVLAGKECSTANFRCDMLAFYTVPAGKRLVVEYAFAEGDIPGGQHFSCFFFPKAGGIPGSLALGMPMSNAAAASGSLTAPFTFVGQMIRFYADPSTTMDASCARDSDSGNATFSLHASGYLVNVP